MSYSSEHNEKAHMLFLKTCRVMYASLKVFRVQ